MYSTNTALSDDQLKRYAPSVFSINAHESRSERYTHIPTIEIVKALRKENFIPFEARQSRSNEGRIDFTRHLIRFRHASQLEQTAVVGKEVNEVVLVNSHDGSSTYQMTAGIFRFVCANGLVVGANLFEDIRIRHQGDVVGRVIEGAYTVLDQFKIVGAHVDNMKSITLKDSEKQAFATSALVAKYGELQPGIESYAITEDQILSPRRSDDNNNDLWSTLNVVQENLIRGGLDSRSVSGNRSRTRQIKGISQTMNLNKALWTLAEEMAKLKTQ